MIQPRIAIPDIAPDAFYRRDPTATVTQLDGETMGTTWSAQIVAAPPAIRPSLETALSTVIASMSHWTPDSALSRFNRTTIGAWQAIPADLAQVLDAALVVQAASGDAFDPAAGRLADLWGFGPHGPVADLPDDDAIAAARFEAGSIERAGGKARRTADVALDLSGIAKGYAVDALAATLRTAGVADFLVEIGGEYMGSGIRLDGQPWWVELEDPPGIALPPLRIALHGMAVATSGDYRRFVVRNGRRLGHTIDPRTGRPITNGIVSASVIAPDCMTADAWATALTVLGPEAGMDMAARHVLAARIVVEDGCESLSPALLLLLEG